MTLDLAVWNSLLAQQLMDTPKLFGFCDCRVFLWSCLILFLFYRPFLMVMMMMITMYRSDGNCFNVATVRDQQTCRTWPCSAKMSKAHVRLTQNDRRNSETFDKERSQDNKKAHQMLPDFVREQSVIMMVDRLENLRGTIPSLGCEP